jgi:YVTN family beta-propeller protein
VVANFTSIVEPFSIAFNPTGTIAYVSDGSGSVAVIDTKAYRVMSSVPADLGAADVIVSPDEAFVFVTNGAAQTVTLIDTHTLKALTNPVNGTPHAGTLAPTQ